MLILNPYNVQYCNVFYPQTDSTTIWPGLNYQGYLFVKVRNYPEIHLNNAIAQCRQFLEQQIPVTSIIVKEPKFVSLWVHNEQIELASTENSPQKAKPSTPAKKPKIEREYRAGEKYLAPGEHIYVSSTAETYEVLTSPPAKAGWILS